MHEDPETFLKNSYGYSMDTLEEAPPVLHTFSHYRLRILPLWAQVQPAGDRIADAGHQWCRNDDIQRMGLPQPVHKLVADFFLSTRQV